MGTIAETIFILALRQSTSFRRAAVLILLALVPLAIVLIGIPLNTEWNTEDLQYFIQGFVINTTLPLMALIISTPLFSDEIEDRTLTNLILAPIARWQIALPKLAAALIIVAVPLIISVFASIMLILDEDTYSGAIVAAFGILIGTIAFISLFAFVGTITTRAVVFGIIYVFGFEALLSSTVPGLKYVSISGITLSVMHELHPGLVASSLSGSNQLPPPVYSIIALVTVIIICNVATVWRLRRMDVN